MAVETNRRERVEARLDRVVAEHRATIALLFPLVGAVLFVTSAEGLVGPPLRFNPFLILFGTLVMRLPLIAGLAPLIDRRAAVGLVFLTGYAYGIEFLGVTTGWPYGSFEYAIELGPMLFGAVPLGLPIFFLPLVFNSYLLCLFILGRVGRKRSVRLPAAIFTVLAVDLVLDPAAVAVGIWTYAGGGFYYGVPLSNYLGWLISATISVIVLDVAFDRLALGERLAECVFVLDDLVSFVLLWGTVNAVYGNWIPVAVALCLLIGLVGTDRYRFPRLVS